MRTMPRCARNQRGIALPMAGIGILAVLGFGLVTLEIGQLGVVRSEMQAAADAAALAGATALAISGRNPEADALEVLERNAVSNTSGGKMLGADNVVSVTFGNWEPGGSFQSNLPPINAIEVIIEEMVDNLGYQPPNGQANTTVVARAVAVTCGSPGAAPDMPLVVGDCRLPPEGSCNSEACMPLLGSVGSTLPQVAWSGLDESASNFRDVLKKFPSSDSCGAPCNGQTTNMPEFEVEDEVSIWKNPHAMLVHCVQQCYVAAGITTVTLPVVPCELGNSAEILGFVRFRIENVQSDFSAPDSGIQMQGTINPPAPGQGECGGNFGMPVVFLVE